MSNTIPQDTPDGNASPRHVVYALSDPRTNEVHYVGRTKQVKRRYTEHLKRAHHNEIKEAWMKELKEVGMVPTLVILESNIDESLICERENHWIQYYLDQGAPLTNINGTPNPSSPIPVPPIVPPENAVAWWVDWGYPPFDIGNDGYPCIGQVIRYYREHSGDPILRTQNGLCATLGVGRHVWHGIENGRVGVSHHRRVLLSELLCIPGFLLQIVTVKSIHGWMASPYDTILEYELVTYPPLPA
jgi:hypothetical protein